MAQVGFSAGLSAEESEALARRIVWYTAGVPATKQPFASAKHRLSFQNYYNNNEKLIAQFNPERWEETHQVNNARPKIVGSACHPAHYTSTENPGYRFRLYFDDRAPGALKIGAKGVWDTFVRWTKPQTPEGQHYVVVAGRTAPPVLNIVWPGAWDGAIPVTLERLGLVDEWRAASGRLVRFVADIECIEFNGGSPAIHPQRALPRSVYDP